MNPLILATVAASFLTSPTPSSVAEIQILPPQAIAAPVAVRHATNPAPAMQPIATITAGPDGAFAYCERGSAAVMACSLTYYPAGTVIAVGQLVRLADGKSYWTVVVAGPIGAPVPPCGACLAAPAIAVRAYVPAWEVR
jgi:hypothetical protein